MRNLFQYFSYGGKVNQIVERRHLVSNNKPDTGAIFSGSIA